MGVGVHQNLGAVRLRHLGLESGAGPQKHAHPGPLKVTTCVDYHAEFGLYVKQY